MNIDSTPALQKIVGDDLDTRLAATLDERVELLYEEGRMSLPGRPEILLDAEMQVQGPADEPDSAAFRQMLGLGDLRQTEHTAIERAGLALLPGGHGELNVVEAQDLKLRLSHDDSANVPARRTSHRGERAGVAQTRLREPSRCSRLRNWTCPPENG